MSAGWMRANLTTQGYCLSDRARELASLRFSTGLCLSWSRALSPVMVRLSGIGLAALAAHPFDHCSPRRARDPRRRRDAFGRNGGCVVS